MFREIINEGLHLIAVGLSLFVLKSYFGMFFKGKEDRKNYFIWFIYAIWQLFLCSRSELPAYINLVVGFLLNCCLGMVSYIGKSIQKIALACMLSMIWTLSEFLVGYFFLSLGINYENPKVLGAVMSEITVLTIIMCLKKFLQHENIKSLPIKHNIALLLIPIGSLFVVYQMFMISGKQVGKTMIKESVLCMVIMLFINLIIFKLYILLADEMELRRYNSVYTQQLELCNKHIQEKEITMFEYRKAKHDIKQHHSLLLTMLNEENYQMAKEYLSDLVEENKNYKISICNTDNLVVDAIINAKSSLMKLMGIDCTVDIHIPTELPFANADISILLGNSIDNAIEATDKVEKDKNIKIYMVYEKNILIITIINPYNTKLIKDKQGIIKTSKSDKNNHGFGLESIKKIVEKYCGSVVIEENNNQFTLKMMLIDIGVKSAF